MFSFTRSKKERNKEILIKILKSIKPEHINKVIWYMITNNKSDVHYKEVAKVLNISTTFAYYLLKVIASVFKHMYYFKKGKLIKILCVRELYIMCENFMHARTSNI